VLCYASGVARNANWKCELGPIYWRTGEKAKFYQEQLLRTVNNLALSQVLELESKINDFDDRSCQAKLPAQYSLFSPYAVK